MSVTWSRFCPTSVPRAARIPTTTFCFKLRLRIGKGKGLAGQSRAGSQRPGLLQRRIREPYFSLGTWIPRRGTFPLPPPLSFSFFSPFFSCFSCVFESSCSVSNQPNPWQELNVCSHSRTKGEGGRSRFSAAWNGLPPLNSRPSVWLLLSLARGWPLKWSGL